MRYGCSTEQANSGSLLQADRFPSPLSSVHTHPDTEASLEREQMRVLGKIPGLNIERGLRILRGNVQKYIVLLGLLSNSYQKHTEQIHVLLAEEFSASMETFAYSLRGTAGMVGAQSVSESADLVLSALHSGREDEVKQHGFVLAESLSTLIGSIQSAMALLDEVSFLMRNASDRTDSPGAPESATESI